MPVPFIILANQRSGSTFVSDMLNSHPEAKVYGELFLPTPKRERPLWEPNDLEFARVFVDRRLEGRPRLTRPYWTARYLARVFGAPGPRAAGMKLMYEQVRAWPETIPYIMARRVRMIHLVRRNLLDIVLSDEVRRRTGVWHVTSDGRPPLPGGQGGAAQARVRLDPDELMGALGHLARNQRVFRTWLAMSRTPAVEVEYERLVVERDRFAGILEFLGLDGDDWHRLQTGLEKVNTRTHAELIENLDEIDARLSRTAFAGFVRR